MPTKRAAGETVVDEEESEHDSAAEVEEVAGATSRHTRSRASNAKDASDSDDERVATSEQEDDDEGGGEEYEIERIIKHKMGHLESGVYAYFVRWKGYGDEENSWVNEADAEGAKELIDEYWEAREDKKAKAKQSPAAPKSRRSQGRKASSELRDNSRPTSVKKSTASTSTSAKRARTSKAKSATPEPPAEDEDMDEVEEPPKKKSRPQSFSSGKKARLSKPDPSPELDTEQEATPLNAGEENGLDDATVYDAEKQFKKSKDWNAIADFVTTVERDSVGTLIVYFQGTDGLRYKAKSAVFRVKSPGKLLDFYESNLKWRPQQPDDAF